MSTPSAPSTPLLPKVESPGNEVEPSADMGVSDEYDAAEDDMAVHEADTLSFQEEDFIAV
jgi:hypothetical protein